MTMPPAFSGSRPPWWPENEPWPPRDGRASWRGRRARLVRRIGLVFALLLALSAIGVMTVASMVWRHLHGGAMSEGPWHGGPWPGGPWHGGPWKGGPDWWPLPAAPLFLLTALFVIVAIAVFFFRGMRRVGLPFSDIVTGADRVAQGDYATRVAERGPPFLRVIARAFNGMTARLQAQDRQRRHLMADIAHELRTPLAVIQGRLEGLLDGVYPRDEAQLARVLEDTRVLARLVEDLRTLANAEAGSLSLRKEPTDLIVLIHDAIAASAPAARERDVTLRVAEPETAAELPLLEVDPLRVREVLTNLLANAIRHTPAGGTVTVEAALAGGADVAVRVRDTGSGIAPEELPRIFDRFYKGASSGGSGLGLTIARNLVSAHGGTIRADSRVGAGTTITFTLPVAPSAESPPSSEPAPPGEAHA